MISLMSTLLPARLEDKDVRGQTPLFIAAENTQLDVTTFLLQNGADPNARSHFGDTALHVGIRRHLGRRYDDVWETRQYAVESLSDFFTDYESSEASDIHRAIDNTRIKIVETLLDNEYTNVNVPNNHGEYPQHVIDFHEHSSKAGNFEVIRKFVNEGYDIMLQDANGLSPFHYALSEGHLDILHFMSTTCGHVLSRVWNTLDHFGKNPLHHHLASIFCSAEIVRLLVQLGCDVNQPDMKGNSPLGLYMDSFHLSHRTDIFWLLALKGADLHWVNEKGQNLAHLLMHHRASHEEILNVLFDNGLDPAATDLDGRTLAHHGAIHGVFTKDLLEFLECRGVLDLHTRDSIGKTPLNYAEEEVNREFPKDIFSIHRQRLRESYDCLKSMSHDLL
jgi:ankyrin repeat protein